LLVLLYTKLAQHLKSGIFKVFLILIIANKNEPENYKSLAAQLANPDEIKIDFLIVGESKKYAIERKTLADLIASHRDGRIWEQCSYLSELREQDYKPIIIIEEIDRWKIFKFQHVTLAQLDGIYIGIASFGIPTIRVNSVSEFIMVIKKLDEKAGKETKYVAPIFKAKNRTPYEIRVDMLRQLEGIGQVTAEKIWEYCKTWENLIECIIEEDGQLMEIVGAKRFNHLREIFVS